MTHPAWEAALRTGGRDPLKMSPAEIRQFMGDPDKGVSVGPGAPSGAELLLAAWRERKSLPGG